MIPHPGLSRRERQIMEFLYDKHAASVAEIQQGLPDPPGYSAVRATANILERKGYLSHARKGKKYLYSSIPSRRREMEGAVEHLLRLYFGGSLEQAVTAMVRLHSRDLSAEDLDRLKRMIRRKVKKEAFP